MGAWQIGALAVMVFLLFGWKVATDRAALVMMVLAFLTLCFALFVAPWIDHADTKRTGTELRQVVGDDGKRYYLVPIETDGDKAPPSE